MSFEKLQGLKDLQKKCNDALKGEDNVIKAEKEIAKLQPKIQNLADDLQALLNEKAKHEVIASGRGGIDNAKIILKQLETDIPRLEKELKK